MQSGCNATPPSPLRPELRRVQQQYSLSRYTTLSYTVYVTRFLNTGLGKIYMGFVPQTSLALKDNVYSCSEKEVQSL